MINAQMVMIGIQLAKDIWQLLHDARHPHYESKIVESVKSQLVKCINDSQLPSPQETIKEISQ